MRRPWQRKANVVYAFPGEAPDLPPLGEGFECRACTPEVIETFFPGAEDAQRRRRYLNFLANGCVGFLIITADGRWASTAWAAPRSARGMPLHVPASVSARENWLFDDHTHPDFRGRGLHRYLVIRRLQHFQQSRSDDSSIAAADVRPENVPSRRSYTSVGFREAGVLSTFELRLPRLPRLLLGRWRPEREHPPLPATERRDAG